MIDILICIIYILMGARWILKKGKNGSDIGSNKLENYHLKF